MKNRYDELIIQAKENNLESQKELALCYFYGDGCKKDFNEFIYWLKIASEHDTGYSQVYLASYYFSLNEDTKVIKYINEAISKKYSPAFYYKGRYIDSNIFDNLDSLSYYKIAAENEHTMGMLMYARKLLIGQDGIVGFFRGFKWLYLGSKSFIDKYQRYNHKDCYEEFISQISFYP